MGRATGDAHGPFPTQDRDRSAPPNRKTGGVRLQKVALSKMAAPPGCSGSPERGFAGLSLHCPLPPRLAQARRERDGALCKGPAATFARAQGAKGSSPAGPRVSLQPQGPLRNSRAPTNELPRNSAIVGGLVRKDAAVLGHLTASPGSLGSVALALV